MIISPIETLLGILAPDECLICKEEGSALCSGCFLASAEQLESRCYNCNKLTRQNRVCESCQSVSRLRRVWWLGQYDGVMKELVLAMKYQRKRAVARLLGEYLSQVLPYLPPETIITHIPTASSRIRRRSYDQARLVAETFARSRGLQYIPLLLRQGQAELVGKTRRERVHIMNKSLVILRPDSAKSKSILLIDDVLTSGASFEAAAGLLRQAGAAHVDAAAIVRGARK